MQAPGIHHVLVVPNSIMDVRHLLHDIGRAVGNESLDDLRMRLIKCYGSIIVGTLGLGTLSLWALSTTSVS